MSKYLMSFLIVLISTTALADGQVLPAETRVEIPGESPFFLAEPAFLLDRYEMIEVLLERRGVELTAQELQGCREREKAQGQESFLEMLGWPVVFTGLVVSVAGGFLIGALVVGNID